MPISVDVSNFRLVNVIDTCAVWNVLSTDILYRTACAAKVVFCCSTYVNYECLHKPRKTWTDVDDELCRRLLAGISQGQFISYDLEIEDLQDMEVLEKRKKLGKGELSSIIFAQKIRQAFMTDDRKAIELGKEVIGSTNVQTTPHLMGWLLFVNHLNDTDKDVIIAEHASMNRPLAPHLEAIYQEAMRCKLLLKS